jgi:phthiocerol/phenolphthiocerol synthesis type-I polyketide synthase E
MAGKFPGAPDLDTFWTNLQNGVESVSFFTPEELRESGIADAVSSHPNFVPARGIVEGADQFDAEFFGYYPREAQILDPQQRLFLECVWQALEDAAVVLDEQNGPTGVFAGSGPSDYGLHLAATPSLASSVDPTQIYFANSPHMLATRVCYKLNLRGPGLSILTACSTSLVAVHLACQSLWQGESAMAIAGGVRVAFPQRAGHMYVPNGALSPDGHCRPFDVAAQGTLGSDGAGAVVLKRLDDALAAGDRVRAIIKGSAINNDGAAKIGFTATSIQGQVNVIRAAHAIAGVPPASIHYIETNGTGTTLGDPIEIAALARAFGKAVPPSSCAVGSLKANIGHTDAAAGISGFIKTVLVLESGKIPPTIHFQRPNPEIDFQSSPFYVNTTLIPFPAGSYPRRAGVSSFGIGGTNAHAVLEQAPPATSTTSSRLWQLLTIAAKTSVAVQASAERLRNHLEAHPDGDLADIAYTLHTGRTHFEQRRIAVCRDGREAIQQLENLGQDAQSRSGTVISSAPLRTAFLFPGGGSQYWQMGRGLYLAEPAFRQVVDSCAVTARQYLGQDIRVLLYDDDAPSPEIAARLARPGLMMICTFVVSYAIAQLLMSLGIEPSAMIGHSLGEYVAATLANVFTLEDALFVITKRGQLLDQTPPGAMLAVQLPESELCAILPAPLSIAALNRPDMCVISGASEEVKAFEQRLLAQGIWHRRLAIAVAGHSPAIERIQPEFREILRDIRLSPPTVPFISCVTGSWITDEQAASADYWVRHLRQPVRFGEGVEALLRHNCNILMEAGPGHTLAALARHSRGWRNQVAIPAMRAAEEPGDDEMFLLSAVGQFWIAGGRINWRRFHSGEQRKRVALPSYPFQRKSYTVRARAFNQNTAGVESGPLEEAGLSGAKGAAANDELAFSASPATETERKLQKIWEELFGIAPIHIQDNFFAIGGDSFLATRFLFRLQTEWKKTVTLRMLSAAPTISRLAVLLDSSEFASSEIAKVASTPETVQQMLADSSFPVPASGFSLPKSPESGGQGLILLTGATGFLGGHLLKQLLVDGQTTVACLARAADDADALTRIRAALSKYGLWEDEFAARIVPLAGDLELPLWGWEAKKFAAIAAMVRSIYHCGAVVHFTYPYAQLKSANVSGTREVLRMACAEHLKPLHHVSTLAVFAPSYYSDQLISEDTPAGPAEQLSTGYSQSKWVAERLIMNAQKAGLPVTIYRPGAVLGDTQTAISRPSDFVWRMLKGAIQLGTAPHLTTGIPAAPADYVAAAIVKLSTMPESSGKTLHLIDPQPLGWAQIFQAARDAFFTLEEMPYVDWYARLRDQKRIDDHNALYPIMHLLDNERPMSGRFTCELTQQFLQGWTGPRSSVGSDLLRRYIDNFIQTGFLSAPHHVNSAAVATTRGN